MGYQYVTTGGVSPITFAITSGSLPAGLSMSTGGLITGTTTTAEHDNSWTVTATDAEGNTAVLVDLAYVLDLLGTPPNSHASTAYSYTLTGTEGTAPYTFALTTGSLPPGLTLASGGLISGTTGATLASYPFTVTMTDAAGVDTVKPYTIQITDGSAADIEPYILDWYTFDNTAYCSLHPPTDQHYWSNANNGAGMVSYPSGVKSTEGEASNTFAAVGLTAATSGMDFSWSGWVHVDSSDAGNTQLGFGQGAAFDTNNGQGFVITTYGDGSKAAGIFAWDGAAYVYNTAVTISGSDRMFCVLTMDGGTNTYKLYVNNALVDTYVMPSYPSTAYLNRLLWRDMFAATLATQPTKLDEVAVFTGLALTSTQRDYLWNGGNGKSYAEVVADALL